MPTKITNHHIEQRNHWDATLATKLEVNESETYDTIVMAHPLSFDNLLVKATYEAKRSRPKAEQVYELVCRKAEAL